MTSMVTIIIFSVHQFFVSVLCPFSTEKSLIAFIVIFSFFQNCFSLELNLLQLCKSYLVCWIGFPMRNAHSPSTGALLYSPLRLRF